MMPAKDITIHQARGPISARTRKTSADDTDHSLLIQGRGRAYPIISLPLPTPIGCKMQQVIALAVPTGAPGYGDEHKVPVKAAGRWASLQKQTNERYGNGTPFTRSYLKYLVRHRRAHELQRD